MQVGGFYIESQSQMKSELSGNCISNCPTSTTVVISMGNTTVNIGYKGDDGAIIPMILDNNVNVLAGSMPTALLLINSKEFKNCRIEIGERALNIYQQRFVDDTECVLLLLNHPENNLQVCMVIL